MEPNGDYIQAFKMVVEIWDYDRKIFEHQGTLNTNLVLVCQTRFAEFCKDWGVARTIRAGRQDDFRLMLRDLPEFVTAMDDATGRLLDQVHENILKPQFGTQNGKRGLISIVSKIATYLKPEFFTAWDQYARFGLNQVTGRAKNAAFESYAQYLQNFNSVWDGIHGQQILALTKNSVEQVQTEPRFQRRVLDQYLMLLGGYEKKENLRTGGCNIIASGS